MACGGGFAEGFGAVACDSEGLLMIGAIVGGIVLLLVALAARRGSTRVYVVTRDQEADAGDVRSGDYRAPLRAAEERRERRRESKAANRRYDLRVWAARRQIRAFRRAYWAQARPMMRADEDPPRWQDLQDSQEWSMDDLQARRALYQVRKFQESEDWQLWQAGRHPAQITAKDVQFQAVQPRRVKGEPVRAVADQ